MRNRTGSKLVKTAFFIKLQEKLQEKLNGSTSNLYPS